MATVDTSARRVSAIDWPTWQALDLATLLFVVRDDKVLLIRKKRGLGAGKINGPGGRIEPGETPLQAAVREVDEGVCVRPLEVAHHGELLFQFVDGYSIHVQVFRADDCEGVPLETDEAIPMWVRLDSIPYEEMWEDDIYWLPLLLEGGRFRGRFVFEGDKLLDHVLEVNNG